MTDRQPELPMSGSAGPTLARAHLWSPSWARSSGDETYRWVLGRRWVGCSVATPTPPVLWVMLNPSTAGATDDDPTIRRCIGFSKAWGFDALQVVNLYAYRATDPKDLIAAAKAGVDIVGSENARHTDEAISECRLIVCAWGANVEAVGRAHDATYPTIAEIVARAGDRPVAHLGLTARGHPRHPLYLSATQQRIPAP